VGYKQSSVCFQSGRTDGELVNLTMAIVAINGWNRLEVSFRGVAGLYKTETHRMREERTLAAGDPAGARSGTGSEMSR
jgi:hypothetical protein